MAGCASQSIPSSLPPDQNWQAQQLEKLTLAQTLTTMPSRTAIAKEIAKQTQGGAFLSFLSTYTELQFEPIWVTRPKRLKALLQAIDTADTHGFNRNHYHWLIIQQLLPSKSATDLARLDLILSSAFTQFIEHSYSGRFDPRAMQQRWYVSKEKLNPGNILSLVANEKKTVDNIIHDFSPPYAGYHLLHQHVQRYKAIVANGGWPKISAGHSLNPGVYHPVITELRQRLAVEPTVSEHEVTVPQPSASSVTAQAMSREHYFSQNLSNTLKKIQKLYGVPASGSLDRATKHALNVRAETRLKQLLVNMERYRWLPRHLGQHYLLVDVAGFDMQVIRAGRQEFSSPVIVGRADRSTPSFSDELQYIEFNPQWNLPNTVIYEDIIPAARRNSSYLQKRRIRVFDGWDENAIEIDSKTVDWHRYSDKPGHRLPYRLRQDAGKHNALGQVKFMFPNPFNIYLHDTPSKQLFNHDIRAFSSGCIRVKNVDQLTRYLFANVAPKSSSNISQLFDNGVNRRIKLDQPLPIHIVYFTAKASANGSVQFRQDFYNRDIEIQQVYQQDWNSLQSLQLAELND